jgi:amino-acid N-acetyltransferase
MTSNAEHIKWFRDSSPYIDAHRGSTMVICLASDALACGNLGNILSDLALLNSLGVRVVLVYGTADDNGQDRPIVSTEKMREITAENGRTTADLIASFSYSRPDLPGRHREITTTSGNYIKAKPFGVVDGIDYLQSGEVRSVNHEAISHQLAGGAIVLIPDIGYSPSGEVFWLETNLVAREVACSLTADKLIYLTAEEGLFDETGALISEVDLSTANMADIGNRPATAGLLQNCDYACRHDVTRCHILSFNADGAILEELFTRDGCGTQIVGHSYERIRPAVLDDVPGVLKLIEPLEAQGVLVKRSRELLESEVDRFYIIERDGLLISCAALYQFGNDGELACLVTHPDYRNSDRGERLLDTIETAATKSGINRLFVLTTQSAHWFEERGFCAAGTDDLPDEKKNFYNFQRGSKVLIKSI